MSIRAKHGLLLVNFEIQLKCKSAWHCNMLGHNFSHTYLQTKTVNGWNQNYNLKALNYLMNYLDIFST